jgi:hypothetical protein
MADTIDMIRIHIIDPRYFKNTENVEIEKLFYSIEIPYQLIQSDATNSFIKGAQNLEAGLNIVVYA